MCDTVASICIKTQITLVFTLVFALPQFHVHFIFRLINVINNIKLYYTVYMIQVFR